MDEKVYIQWSVVNWLTIFLMATVGFVLLGLVSQAALNMTAKMRSGAQV